MDFQGTRVQLVWVVFGISVCTAFSISVQCNTIILKFSEVFEIRPYISSRRWRDTLIMAFKKHWPDSTKCCCTKIPCDIPVVYSCALVFHRKVLRSIVLPNSSVKDHFVPSYFRSEFTIVLPFTLF